MVDTWATVGSCAQIGENVHLSGGVGIGGVLEPPQAAPVMVGDDACIGSRCIVAEGARVGDGAVLGAGVHPDRLDPRHRRRDRRGAEPGRGALVVRRRLGHPAPHLPRAASSACPACWSIKRLEPGERHDKSTLNEVLRDHGAAT